MLDSLSIVPDLLDATTCSTSARAAVSRAAARGGVSGARVHAHRRHAEEDPLRERSDRALGITNAKAVAMRAEDLDEPKFDAVIVRAVGSLARRTT
jgi:hypothetical protein